MNRSLDLLPKDLFDSSMVVTKRIDRNAGEEIEISLVGFVDEISATPTVREKLIPGIRSQ